MCYQGEMEEPTFNYYFNTFEEFKTPFLNKDSVLYREGLRLDDLKTEIATYAFQRRLQVLCTLGG